MSEMRSRGRFVFGSDVRLGKSRIQSGLNSIRIWTIKKEVKSEPIADNLVVVLPRGVDLTEWKRVGLMERDWSLYRRVGSSFSRVVLVVNGARAESDLKAELDLDWDASAKLFVITNDTGESTDRYEASLPDRVFQAVLPGRTIVKTEQLTAGVIAVEIRDRLRREGQEAVLISRGGHLWSRFAANEFGPGSEEARVVGIAERHLCRSADLLVGTTKEMVVDMCWRYRVDLARTAVIPNFVIPHDKVRSTMDRVPGLISTVGPLVGRKRIGILIEAVAALDAELRSRVTLEVIGDGPEEAALRDLACRVDAPVRFLPPMGHAVMREQMAKSMLYAQASEMEGHAKAVIDAMAAGAVAVVADSPGLGSLVRTGVTGVLVPSSNPADFANAITGLLGDADWCEQIGGTAARIATSIYGIDTIVEQEAAAYRQSLELSAAHRDVA